MHRRSLLGLALLLAAPCALAANCSSTGNGNWNTAGIWSCGAVPGAGDNVTIQNGNDVTVTTNVSAATITITNSNSNNLLITGGSVTVTGSVTFASAGTNTNRVRSIQLSSGTSLSVGGDLTLDNGSRASDVVTLQIAANATVSVAGAVTYGTSVAPTITFTGAGTLNVGGDFDNGAIFTPSSGTVNYNGAGAQNLGTYTYNNLTISKSGGTATATGNVTAAALTFAAGNAGLVNMSSGTLTVTGACPAAIARTGNGYVIGALRLTYAAGNQTCTYPVGDATNYTPITLALTGATAGTITGSVANAAPPNLSISPLSSAKYVNRYWTLGSAGDTATATSYNATLNWVAGDIQGGGNYQNFIVGEYTASGGWLAPNPSFASNAPTSIIATNIATAFTSAASFGVGEPYACLPPTNVPAGVTVACVCDNFGRATLNPSTIFNSNWLLSTSSGTFGIPHIVNQGRLELTDNTGNNASAATVPGIFPAAGNYISVEFQQYAYNGSGADGIAVTLSDYSIAPTPGAYGGSLGYAQKTGINGFAGGWIGVALDEYGNYPNPTEGRIGGPGFFAQSVGVRGSGSGTTGYPWVGGNTSGTVAIAVPGSTAPVPGNMYQIIVDARNYTGGTKSALVSVNRDTTTKTGANYASAVAPFDMYVANPAQAAVPVNWQISFTGSTGGSTDIHEIGNLKVCAQTLIAPTGGSTAAGFNIIDSALPNTKQNALFGHIYMKVANVPFKLNVAALAPPVGGVSQGVNTAYASSSNKTVTVNLIDDSQAGGACNASSAACSACAKTVVASQTMTFTSSDAGFKTSANFTVAGAYKRLIAQVVDATSSPTVYGCSTDAFSVRPAWYTLSSSVSSPTKAGTSFTITATPVNVSGTTLSGTTGSPTLDNSKAPTAGGNQTLLLQSWNAGASFGTFIYNDVGNFTLPANAIYDTQFGNATGEAQDRTNGDCNPGSGSNPYSPLICYGYSGASCTNASPYSPDSSGKYSCDIGSALSPSIGRFYPDHYEATVALTQGCAANGFTYMAQPFSMTNGSSGAIQVKALAAGQTFASSPGLPSFTTGYGFLSQLWFGAENAASTTTDLIQCINSTPNTSANRCALTVLPTTAAPSTAWVAGVYTAPATTFYFDPPKDTQTIPNATWGPYDSLNVGVFVSDADGSTLTIPAGQSFTLNGKLYQAINGSTTMKERYGRMRIQNASGSDQIPMAVPVWLEYWSGSAWMPNALDTSCTSLVAAPTPFSGNSAANACFGTGCTGATTGAVGSLYTTRTKAVGANAVAPSYSSPNFSFGVRNVLLSPPKASGTIGLSIEAPTWLEIGPNDPTGADPVASIRFGTYNTRFIFLRENY